MSDIQKMIDDHRIISKDLRYGDYIFTPSELKSLLEQVAKEPISELKRVHSFMQELYNCSKEDKNKIDQDLKYHMDKNAEALKLLESLTKDLTFNED